jgi:DNA-binding winged helix-turn-helix (wHTH) protein
VKILRDLFGSSEFSKGAPGRPGLGFDPKLWRAVAEWDNLAGIQMVPFTATVLPGLLMDLAFADCVFKPASRQLLRNGEAVPLEPKSFTLLEVLIERRPAVVTYNEIDELLWPKVYVARTSLTRLVSELRAALGDSPGDGHIIRTVYKTGYAFAAAVTPVGQPHAAAAATSVLWNGRLLPLVEGENIAGRGIECSLVIEAASVSRRHARFVISAGSASVEDLGSTNGTFVNEAPISMATALKDGDVVTLGKASMKIRTFDPAAPTEVTNLRAAERESP